MDISSFSSELELSTAAILLHKPAHLISLPRGVAIYFMGRGHSTTEWVWL